jgi:hypothetical protein
MFPKNPICLFLNIRFCPIYILHTGWPVFSFWLYFLMWKPNLYHLMQHTCVTTGSAGASETSDWGHNYFPLLYGPVFHASWSRRWRYLTAKLLQPNSTVFLFSEFSFRFYAIYCNVGLYSLVVFSLLSLPFRPSSGVQVVVMKEPAAQCKAVLFLFCSCLGLLLVMWVNRLFLFGCPWPIVFALWFCWFVVCGCPECPCFPYSSIWKWRRRDPPKGLI